MRTWLCGMVLAGGLACGQEQRPNVILILADDLGYGELGCYGQALMQTPQLDRMAAEGMRFTQFYAGNTVCAPSRSVLMTGRHMGHTRVRGNAGPENPSAQTLRAGDATIARMLQAVGYRTALVGKWGLGLAHEEGEPRKQGFDEYFGFLSQTHAHNHFRNFLWRNGERVPLPNDLVPVGRIEGTGYATKRLQYAGDLFAAEAQRFVRENARRPFFLYLSVIVPHANNERARALGDGHEVPELGPYADKPWPPTAKAHAAMITRLDAQVGELLMELKQLGIDERTLVIFSSDNGPHQEGGPAYDPGFFEVCGPLSGLKRTLTEGGIRVPLLARWPGRIKPGGVSGYVGYFGDFMATFAELAGATQPEGHDSVSFAPTLLGRAAQAKHQHLYWEFYENGVSQAVLIEGRWKAIRERSVDAALKVFDLESDIGERMDVAVEWPEIAAQAVRIMREAHVPNEHWRIK